MRRLFCIGFLIILISLYIFSNSYYALTLILAYLLFVICSAVSVVNSYAELSILMPGSIRKNDEIGISFISKNDSVLPIARMECTVLCENALVGEKTKRRLSCSPSSKSTTETTLYATGFRIGKIDVTVENLKIWDFLGLFCISVPAPRTASGFIYPEFKDIDIAVDSLPEIPGEGERYYPGKRGRDVNEQLTLREYDSGDELRTVHWKLTSKMDKLIVREFGLPVRYSVMVIIELMTSGTHASEKLDECVETGLSLSLSLIKQGINHNLAWYAEQTLITREIANEDDLQTSLSDMLSASAYTGLSYAIDAYIESEYVSQRLAPIYVTAVLDTVKMSEVSVRQPLKVYYVADKDTALDDVAKHLDITIIEP